MNKYEICDGVIRQNIYNILDREGYYKSYTCYHNDAGKIFMVFNASKGHNLISMIPDDSLEILELDDETLEIIKECMLSWSYSHLKPIQLYGENKWTIFDLEERDKFVISKLNNSTQCKP